MQYRLRTLLIVLALGPPVLAVLWWFSDSTTAVIGLVAFAALVAGWYWMLRRRQAMPLDTRGRPTYDDGGEF